MSSGIKVSDEVKSTYEQVSMNTSKTKKLKYAVFKFSEDEKTIILDSDRVDDGHEMDYDELISNLPENDVRYVAYDFDFMNKDGAKTSELVVVSWHPGNTPVRRKMMCASSFKALKDSLKPKHCIEADDCGDAESKAVLEKVNGTRPTK